MSYEPGNPYASPTTPAPPPGPNPGSLQLMEAFNYIFRADNWLMNVLLSAVCMLIPIIGPIVLLGYQFEVLESLHRNAGRAYPDFDFNRFGAYVGRGVWPFLVGFVASIVLVPVMWVMMFIPIMCAGSIGNSGEGAKIIGVIMLLGMVVTMFLFIAILSMVMIPLQLRAGLMQEFAGAFSFSFVKDFIARTWQEIILQALFMAVAGFVLILCGLIACVVGIYASIAIISLAQAHFHYQLYEIYLVRGGEPVPLKPQLA